MTVLAFSSAPDLRALAEGRPMAPMGCPHCPRCMDTAPSPGAAPASPRGQGGEHRDQPGGDPG